MNSFFRKLLWLKQRKRKEDELREEIQFHHDEEAEQLVQIARDTGGNPGYIVRTARNRALPSATRS